ncbi:MAG: alginate export family protein [Colwellia sp.]|nr:alginate export family protein [Colwellia sp.]MCW9082799.1 alginate export family protein [Colwellia sp.]
MNTNKFTLSLLTAAILAAPSAFAAESDLGSALTDGKLSADFNLRYEGVEQDNALKDADALTLRTRINYTTGTFNGFSAAVELENSVALVDDYNDATGEGAGYSVIADPDHTELDQAYLAYKNDKFSGKIGRQVITMDNHRFVGHVGWRQDRQTFDALTLGYQLSDATQATYAYITKRNRIFSDKKDIDSKDHLLNISHKLATGKLTGYAYLLEEDKTGGAEINTYGLRYAGSTKLGENKVTYSAEFATQDNDTLDKSANYFAVDAGTKVASINVNVGYELLGSDDGEYGFATPLATLHKFNGWADQFLGTPKEGLQDIYASVGGKLAGGSWKVVYHDFSADESSDTVDDLGSEIDAVYTKAINKTFKAGIKYAAYNAGDIKVDTDKVWVWVSAKF